MIVAPEVTRALVEAELAELEPWRQARGFALDWDPSRPALRARLRSAVDGEEYVLEFLLDGYRAQPPLIEFALPGSGERGTRRCYPHGGRGYFHDQPVLCAPWNRRAYAAHGGPHGDWNMSQWATLRPNHARLGDMLVLLQELLDDRASYAGRKAR